MGQKIIVFVSGCFDVLHGGHIEFLSQAKALGNYLVVCVPTDDVIQLHKNRRPALSFDHRLQLLKALSMVDEVVTGADPEPGLNFKTEFLKIKPAILAVTEDDTYTAAKVELCNSIGVRYVRLTKTLPFEKASSTSICNYIKAPEEVPLRVDFGGGWLDVPHLSQNGAYVVNCTITPSVRLSKWNYQIGGGLGGSAAYKILLGESSMEKELESGAGWQDAAVIQETGLCSWHSGSKPKLALKRNGELLRGSMALWWTGEAHNTPQLSRSKRNYDLIIQAGVKCHEALRWSDFGPFWEKLLDGVRLSYLAQLEEGMKRLPDVPGSHAKKYCGSGFGGYALYLFTNSSVRDIFVEKTAGALAIEPYIKPIT